MIKVIFFNMKVLNILIILSCAILLSLVWQIESFASETSTLSQSVERTTTTTREMDTDSTIQDNSLNQRKLPTDQDAITSTQRQINQDNDSSPKATSTLRSETETTDTQIRTEILQGERETPEKTEETQKTIEAQTRLRSASFILPVDNQQGRLEYKSQGQEREVEINLGDGLKAEQRTEDEITIREENQEFRIK
ncbi:MAG: hypothetical protein Q8N42_00095, partial [bacterium]|nr:hypothetical protein [bacterium]